MNEPLTVALVSAGSAIAGSLLTIFFSPRLQHYFWTRQRRVEIQHSVINELNRLMSEYIVKYKGDGSYRPSEEFHQSLATVTAQVTTLFSAASLQLFNKMTNLIPYTPGIHTGFTLYQQEVSKARDAALRSLYQEIGLL